MLKETSKKYEQTIIMITHNRGIAQTADRVLQVSVFDRIMRNTEYSCAVTPQIRQAGNRLSGLAETAYASLLA